MNPVSHNSLGDLFIQGMQMVSLQPEVRAGLKLQLASFVVITAMDPVSQMNAICACEVEYANSENQIVNAWN